MSVSVLNTDAGLSGKTLVNAEDSQTVTGLKTFDRDPNAPFAVSAGSAKVDNLDADKLDGNDGAYYEPSIVTITSTGTVNDAAITMTGRLVVIRCDNATDLTLTGISAGDDGQRIRLISIGAGNVFLKHQDTGSVAANRLINFATSGDTPLAAGVGTAEYVYDGTTDRWRLVQHEQGDWLDYSGASTITGWSSFTSGRKVIQYRLSGRSLSVVFHLEGTSNSTAATFTIPYSAKSVYEMAASLGVTYDNSAWGNNGVVQIAPSTSSTQVSCLKALAGAWTSSGGKIVDGNLTIPVQ